MPARQLTNTEGWGPTAFSVALDATHSAELFIGEGYIIEHESPWIGSIFKQNMGSLDLFLELQRENRIPPSMQVNPS